MSPGVVVGPNFGNGSCSIPSAGGGGGTGALGGSLTTVFTWVPSKDDFGIPNWWDLPPVDAIVYETCSVYSSAQAYPGATSASAVNGLDARFCTNTSVSNSPISYYPGYVIGSGSSGYSTGTAARIVPGGLTVTVTCTPSATCASGNGPYSMTFSYSASVSPVKIGLIGVVKERATTYGEIGRLTTGFLAGGPGIEFSNHDWDFGGSDYREFRVELARGYTVSTGAYPLLGLADEHSKPMPSWRWRGQSSSSGGTLSVQCTATAKYDGIAIGTVHPSQSVVLEQPELLFMPQQFSEHTVTYKGMPSYLDSADGSIGWSGSGFSEFYGTAWTYLGLPCPHFPGGRLLTVQLIDCLWIDDFGIRWQDTDGEYCLDNRYPYGNVYTLSPSGVPLEEHDEPSFEVGDLLAGVSLFASTSFRDQIMYRPAGEPPVADTSVFLFTWNWNAESESNPRGFGTNPPPFGGLASPYFLHPSWEDVVRNVGVPDPN